MAKIFKTKSGKDIVLCNGSEKAKRFGRQLKNNAITETGEVLSESDRAYRKGYLNARSDSAMMYLAKNDRDGYEKAKKKKKEQRQTWFSNKDKK